MTRLLIILIVLVSINITAQDNCEESKLNVSANADLVSRYIWRGMEFGENTPHFQPYLSLGYNLSEAVSFSLGAWGSYGFTGIYNESDLSATILYSTEKSGSFSIGLSDYFYPYLGMEYSNYKKEGEGAHTMEIAFNYYGTECMPIHILVSNNILNTPKDEKSFYAELGYTFNVKDATLSLFAGGATGISSWHLIPDTGFKIINAGITASKSLTINDNLSIPVSVSWIMNPYLKTTYLVGKVTIF